MIKLLHIPAEPGTIRTYQTHDGRFRIHLLSPSKRSTRNSWRVDDLLTGAYFHTWNRQEAVEQVTLLTRLLPAEDDLPPRQRFVVYPRTTTPVSPESFVLIDLVTGRYWLRHSTEDVMRDEAVLLSLA